jgi:hypothetical protein
MEWYVYTIHITIPTWQAECARPEKRGRVIILAGAIISGGVMIVSLLGERITGGGPSNINHV